MKAVQSLLDSQGPGDRAAVFLWSNLTGDLVWLSGVGVSLCCQFSNPFYNHKTSAQRRMNNCRFFENNCYGFQKKTTVREHKIQAESQV